MTLLACRKGPDSQQSVTHPSARVMCVRPWFTPLLPGNQSVGPWPSFWLGKELSMFLLSLFLPLNRARDIVFLHFSCEGGKDGASAADKDPGDLKTWEVLVPKASLTNRAAWPSTGRQNVTSDQGHESYGRESRVFSLPAFSWWKPSTFCLPSAKPTSTVRLESWELTQLLPMKDMS